MLTSNEVSTVQDSRSSRKLGLVHCAISLWMSQRMFHREINCKAICNAFSPPVSCVLFLNELILVKLLYDYFKILAFFKKDLNVKVASQLA